MGVRFNAEKSKHGMYYSSPIWQFKMRCVSCSGTIIIRADPQLGDFELIEGARKDERYAYEAEPANQITSATGDKSNLELLEKDVVDKKQAEVDKPILMRLLAKKNREWKDPYTANSELRTNMRVCISVHLRCRDWKTYWASILCSARNWSSRMKRNKSKHCNLDYHLIRQFLSFPCRRILLSTRKFLLNPNLKLLRSERLSKMFFGGLHDVYPGRWPGLD